MNLNLLKEKREKMGLKQGAIAEKLDITAKTYNFKENGRTEFKISESVLLCDILKISQHEFIEIFFDGVFPNVKY